MHVLYQGVGVTDDTVYMLFERYRQIHRVIARGLFYQLTFMF